MSKSRRHQIIPGLNKPAKEVADSNDTDEFLFGKDFGEGGAETRCPTLWRSTRRTYESTNERRGK